MSESLFAPALEEMRSAGRNHSDPQPFQSYLRQHGLKATKTAQAISVQELASLDPFLRDANTMVFRLGQGTFALCKAQASVSEFFLMDSTLFAGVTEQTFVPDSSYAELFPYSLIGTLTEVGEVNIAIASGLLGHALGCDLPSARVAPATGAATYSFIVRPHSHQPTLEWQHGNGQVEIDSVYFAKRNKRWTLFIIEAKHGGGQSLAKSKLAYACSALSTKRIPSDVPIVPVYMRALQTEVGRILFSIAECRALNVGEPFFVSDIKPERSTIHRLCL